MAQTTFKSITVSVTILVIAALGFAYFVATPQWSNYNTAKAQLATLKENSTKLTAALNSVQGFLTSYQSLQSSVSQVNLALPRKSSQIADFMSNVGNLAQSSGIVLSNFTIDNQSPLAQTTSQTNVISPMTFSLTASGSFPAFKAFILNLEGFLRIVDIDHVTMKSNETGLILYQMHLQTYYQQ